MTDARRHHARRFRGIWGLRLVVAASLLGLVILNLVGIEDPRPEVATSTPGILVGTPGGDVLSEPGTPTPVAPASPAFNSPTPVATRSPVIVAAPDPTPLPPAPTVVATPIAPSWPATPAATVGGQPPAPTPTPVVVAAVDAPEAAVNAFYRYVVAKEFDQAYALWSDGMKATYPRQENLDGRFAHTRQVTFDQLATVAQTPTTADVQANFTETYDTGGSRTFIGYWRLILVDGRWLLNEPHY